MRGAGCILRLFLIGYLSTHLYTLEAKDENEPLTPALLFWRGEGETLPAFFRYHASATR